MKKTLLLVFTVVFLGSSLIIAALIINSKPNYSAAVPLASPQTQNLSNQNANSSVLAASRQSIKVTRVIDGDTIEVEGGQKIRYIGIDTPETVHPNKSLECFGIEASNKNKELVEGKEVELEKDVSETDKYGRLLRYVYIDNIFINDFLVRQGYAHASSYPPDVKYQDLFKSAEQEAKDNSRGLWPSCPAGTSQQSPNSQAPNTNSQSGCSIKGNISASGEKIYHMPHQLYYDKTVIDVSRGERWFCTEDEALTAGWRKAKK